MRKIHKILFITLSNIGDVILTLPVLDALRERLPQSSLTIMAGPRSKEIFDHCPGLARFIVYDKHAARMEKIRLLRDLRKEKFDMVVDLRNSLFQVLLGARVATSFLNFAPSSLRHMRERHFHKVGNLLGEEFSRAGSAQRFSSFQISAKEEEEASALLRKNRISEKDKFVVVAAGARSHIKRWPQEKFAQLVSWLSESLGVKVILVGDKFDAGVHQSIARDSRLGAVDISGQTNIAHLAWLLKKSEFLITNDSACLHLAGYLDVAVVAIFGPTDESKYGPWSKHFSVVKKDIFCRPCSRAQCRFGHLKCMHLIKVEDVKRHVMDIWSIRATPGPIAPWHKGLPSAPLLGRLAGVRQCARPKNDFRRILVARTDRIGDVVLSTPVIKSLRSAYPDSFIAMMVSPYTKDLVEGNPYLDEVIVYDKEGRHKSWWGSIRFALTLKKKKFDLALALHPVIRVHLILAFAGIRRRMGFDRKYGFLLTDRVSHVKQYGEKHESEYALDLVRRLGLEPKDIEPILPVCAAAEKWADELLTREGVIGSDRLLVIHPGASCPSKIWPNERFAQVADRLADKYGFKTFVIAGPKDRALADSIIKGMRRAAVNLAGNISLSQLASLLRRSHLFISSDSGPVHMAAALGVPLVSLFARNEPGLSPKRWGPLGRRSRILHKQVGCLKCLAHNCIRGFACLKAISVEDVCLAAESVLNLD